MATNIKTNGLIVLLLQLFFIFFCVTLIESSQATASLPNIVILLADDTGWGDLSCYGNPSIVTSNLDKMASEGLRFTRFYSAAPVCTPSRSSLLTGRLQVRNGCYANSSLIDGVFDPASTGGLPQSEITIAKALKTKGYATTAIGKWHLGNLPQFRAVSHGFDSYLGIPYSHDMCPCFNEAVPSDHCSDQWPGCPIYENNTIIQQPADLETITERYTQWALSFMDKNARSKTPFFLYFAYHHSHHPVFSSKRFHGISKRGFYGDSMIEMDWSVGQILRKLQELKIAENSFVFFTSDNGPDTPQGVNGGSAGPLKCGKGVVWEGGIREPAIAWWPGKIEPARITLELGSTMDLFTTSLKLAGISLPADRFIDGKDLSPILFEKNKPSETKFLFHYQGTTDVYAVTMGPYKAHYIECGWLGGVCGPPTPQKLDPPLLFQIEHDPSEMFPIASNSTEYINIIKQINEGLAEHLRSIVYYKPPQFDLPDNPDVEPCCNKQTNCVCGQPLYVGNLFI